MSDNSDLIQKLWADDPAEVAQVRRGLPKSQTIKFEVVEVLRLRRELGAKAHRK